MCGFVGYVDLHRDIVKEKETILQMNNTLKKREPDEEGYYANSHIQLGHRRLIITDAKGRKATYGVSV